jgi:hypothetical protein
MLRTALAEILISFHERHHADVDIDLEMWGNVLSRLADTDTLPNALDEWHWQHPDEAPKPAFINELIRNPNSKRNVKATIRDMRRTIKASIAKRDAERGRLNGPPPPDRQEAS